MVRVAIREPYGFAAVNMVQLLGRDALRHSPAPEIRFAAIQGSVDRTGVPIVHNNRRISNRFKTKHALPEPTACF